MASTHPKICFIVNDLTQTTAVYDLAPAIIDYTDINEVGILTWFESSIENLPTEGIHIHELNANRRFLGLSPSKILEARNFINNYDIIQVHHFPSDIYLKILSLDKITIVRDGNSHNGYSWPIRLSRGISNIIVDQVICVSDSVADSYHSWENKMIKGEKSVIYSGIEPDIVRNTSTEIVLDESILNSDIIIGTVGKLEGQKAHDILIRSISIVRNKYDLDVHLVIAGDGSLKYNLEELVNELGLEERVSFLGLLEREEVYSLLNKIDMFTMPSRWEGFCIAVLQAMSAGTPCILSEIEAFERPFSKDHAVFTTVDNPKDLAEAIRMLSMDDKARRNYGRKGRKLVNNQYTAKHMAEEYYKKYIKLS